MRLTFQLADLDKVDDPSLCEGVAPTPPKSSKEKTEHFLRK